MGEIMATYTETKATLDDIAARSENNRKRIESAKAALATAEADLALMATAYASFVAQLDIDASANPDDSAWQTAKAEKDQMVADFQSLKIRATNMKTAVDAL